MASRGDKYLIVVADELDLIIHFEESGGGWTNPLIGRVLDSTKDMPKDEIQNFLALLEVCEFKKMVLRRSAPTADMTSFTLKIVYKGNEVSASGQFFEFEKEVRDLIGFLRKHSRKVLLD